jgi:tetratricopeptide (TPR) repeat protein
LLYTTAKAYRLASYWPELLLSENRLVHEDSLLQWKSQRKELLVRSRETYAQLRQELNGSGNGQWIEANAKEMLCNSYFGEADLLFHEGEFQAAMAAYREAANRFINEPESLEALVQIARCQEELRLVPEMRRTLEMARDVLNRIPKEQDDRFVRNTRHDRKSWEKQITWMIEAIDRKQIR